MYVLRLVVRPFGYLAFIVALSALSAAARILGDRHELGFFSGRLAKLLWRYPEVTRRGVQMAWLAWAAAFVLALSPFDPIASRWDEAVLAAAALVAIWPRLAAAHRAEH